MSLHRGIKSWVKVEAVYSKESEQKTINAVLNTHAAVIFNEFQIDETITKFNTEVQKANENFCRE